MVEDFNLTSELKDNKLIIKTTGYINNTGGEKIVQEFNKHTDIKRLILNLEESKVVNSIGISHLIEIIEKLNDKNGKLIFTNLARLLKKHLRLWDYFSLLKKPIVSNLR